MADIPPNLREAVEIMARAKVKWSGHDPDEMVGYVRNSDSEFAKEVLMSRWRWLADGEAAALCALLAGGWSVLPPEPIVSSGTLDPATKREWDIQGQLGQWVRRAKPSAYVVTKAICAHYDEYTPKCLFATRNWSASCSPERCVDCPDAPDVGAADER
jgi:hypothetical protein